MLIYFNIRTSTFCSSSATYSSIKLLTAFVNCSSDNCVGLVTIFVCDVNLDDDINDKLWLRVLSTTGLSRLYELVLI
jgi:hypothetical protein